MKVPLSWIKDYVDVDLPLDELARMLTWAGLEVEEVRVIGLPLPECKQNQSKFCGLPWERDKIVIGAVLEVHPHPDADRLTLLQLDDGEQIHTVLTGSPSLLPYKTIGKLPKPLKVAYARENALLYDGHKPGNEPVRLKKTKIRGVVSYSMVCSEKELGISDTAEDIMYFDDDAPVGMPLADYLGDAVLEIAITPNIARDANIVGVAREIAALTGAPLRQPDLSMLAQGAPLQGRVSIEITDPVLNPRFAVGLIENIEIKPSPALIQRRLTLAGMRPINNIVDATNYVMLELGEPLHAFDYDVLVQRAGGKAPTIITRTARPGERLTTLDGVDRPLDDFTELVCDTQGILSIAGVMGGAESEVSERTRNVLLEGASWNYINIRKTTLAQKLSSEAGYRMSRGVHPAMAERGTRRALELMRQWSGGTIAQGLVDAYPLPPKDSVVEITLKDVHRWLGIVLSAAEVSSILQRLEFKVEALDGALRVTAPDHRLDIGEGVIGKADVIEEIARIYGYERIPEARLAEALPPQRGNLTLDFEEKVRDLLVRCGLQEVMSYRMTTPEREARLQPKGTDVERPYVWLANPITCERTVLRRSLLASVMESMEHNTRIRPRIAIFEIGNVFIPLEQFDAATGTFCNEPVRLAIAISGPRALPAWQPADNTPMDFYDLKGVIEALLNGLHVENVRFEPTEHPSFHPGKCARIWAGHEHTSDSPGTANVSGYYDLGVMGELHPLLRQNYEELPSTPILAAELDMEALRGLVSELYLVTPVPAFPPVLEDLAFVLDETVPAGKVEELIRQTGGVTLTAVRLFDVYRGEKIGAGKKSLAFNLTYQAEDRTLTDEQAAKIRTRIIQRLEKELGAKLRS